MPVRLSVEASAVLAAAPVVWLTTLRGDGSPHVTPTWFVVDDARLWIASARSNVKVRNLARDPRVSVAVDGSALQPLVAEGRATVKGLDDVPVGLLERFVTKYAWDPRDPEPDGERAAVEIVVERWLLAW